MTALLDTVFGRGGLSARFQPVIDLGCTPLRTCYVEGLVRGPAGTNLVSADILFSYIRRKSEVVRMDRACVATILAEARKLPAGTLLGLNVDAQTLVHDRRFAQYLCDMGALAGFRPEQIVVEIVEHSRPTDDKAFGEAVAELRRAGMRVALDDIGCAHSNYRMMLETRPDFFKIDRYFVRGVQADPLRYDILLSIAQLARSFGACVVAEGVETEAELAAVRAAGIDLIQGFLVPALLMREALAELKRTTSAGSDRREGEEARGVEEHGYR